MLICKKSVEMKRAIYIALTAILLAGCGEWNGDMPIGKSDEIVFNAKHVMRGALNQTDIDNGTGKVYVCGVQNNSSKIFNNVAITRDATTGKWFSSTKRNWVEGSSYSFHAYAYSTLNGLTIDSSKDGLEISVQQPTSYNESAMIDYLLSYSFKVADGAMKPIVQLYLEHAMSLVEIYVVRGNMFDARLTKMTFENIYTQGSMKCTAQAVANSGNKNVWEISPSGSNDVVYTYEPATPVVIGDERETTEAKMAIMCLPQQLTANSKLTIEYEVNEKVTPESPDNFVLHRETFQLYNYQPMNYKSGHRIVYTATVDSGVNLVGSVAEWKDVDYIEGTVLPEIK
jgi:hypothetical protein